MTERVSEAVRAADRPYLRIANLTKKFGEFVALRDVSLDVYDGEFVCFLGPSGCGKTTLLRAIAGLDIQTMGTVEQAGADISALPPSERDFGIVFQSYALFPNLTVRKNVAYGLRSRNVGKAAIADRVSELLALVGLPEQADKYPAQLSGGQQQRVAVARAIATSPGLLLLDEPLSALDAKVRVHLRHEIKALQRRLGVTTIMVTHDQEEALSMADRIVVMNNGVIEQIGTPGQVYGEPATIFVADFIGTMNFLTGTVTADGAVRVGQLEVACDTTGVAVGDPVTVAVRPEDIVVHEAEGIDGTSATATIEAMEFLGSFVRAELGCEQLGSGRPLRADLSVGLVRRRTLAEDDSLTVIMPRERIHVFRGAASNG